MRLTEEYIKENDMNKKAVEAYCVWCWFRDYGKCTECAVQLKKESKSEQPK